jgi:type IV secretion system protein VirB11
MFFNYYDKINFIIVIIFAQNFLPKSYLHMETNSAEARLRASLRREMGPLVLSALEDPKTKEVMLNPDGSLWLDRTGEPMRRIGEMSTYVAESVIRTVASYLHKEAKRASPIVEGEFPLDGSRFAGQLPPIVKAAAFSIRKKASSLFTLEQYEFSKIITATQRYVLEEAVKQHKNILVAGGTSSGKTTFINAIIAEMQKQYP